MSPESKIRTPEVREVLVPDDWDINTPGLLVHGCTDGLRGRWKIGDILRKGILPFNVLYPGQESGNSFHPDNTSFSVINKGGYEKTCACWLYGAKKKIRRFGHIFSISVILDPGYVVDNFDKFVRVGTCLEERVCSQECWKVVSKFSTENVEEVFGDEIHGEKVPLEGIGGIIVSSRFLRRSTDDVSRLLLDIERFPYELRLFDTNNVRYI